MKNHIANGTDLSAQTTVAYTCGSSRLFKALTVPIGAVMRSSICPWTVWKVICTTRASPKITDTHTHTQRQSQIIMSQLFPGWHTWRHTTQWMGGLNEYIVTYLVEEVEEVGVVRRAFEVLLEGQVYAALQIDPIVARVHANLPYTQRKFQQISIKQRFWDHLSGLRHHINLGRGNKRRYYSLLDECTSMS
eukprot:scaffold89759_cov23-Prasinocladus_malaysianus.AAC.1